jgi:hypothetical protein
MHAKKLWPQKTVHHGGKRTPTSVRAPAHGKSVRQRDTPCEREHPVVDSKRIPAYQRLGPYMRARGAPSGGAGARSSQGPPQSTSIAMRPRTRNCGGTNAADDTADAPYRPDTYITDTTRDDSVTGVHSRPNTRTGHRTLVSLQTCIASSDVPRRAIPGATTTGVESTAETRA